MRIDYVRTFLDSTTELLAEVMGPDVEVCSVGMQPSLASTRDVVSIIGLTGDACGRVIFDMDSRTAVGVAGQLLGEATNGMTPLVRSSIAELTSMAIGRAISRINDEGSRIRMSPPTVITGANLMSYDLCFETLVAPVRTSHGEVRVNITLQEAE